MTLPTAEDVAAKFLALAETGVTANGEYFDFAREALIMEITPKAIALASAGMLACGVAFGVGVRVGLAGFMVPAAHPVAPSHVAAPASGGIGSGSGVGSGSGSGATAGARPHRCSNSRPGRNWQCHRRAMCGGGGNGAAGGARGAGELACAGARAGGAGAVAPPALPILNRNPD